MATQPNPGESPANTQTGTRSHQNMGDDQGKQAKPIEEKHLNDAATGKQAPSAHPKRAPEHEPGYEAKHRKEAEKEGEHKKSASDRSQADDSMAKIDADRDVEATKTQKANRTHPARAKQHVRRMAPKPTRRHK